MIRQTLAVGAWFAAGALGLLGLYYALLTTPDSSALMLALSALLALLMLVTAGIVINAGVLLSMRVPLREAIARAMRGMHWFVLAAIPVLAAAVALRRGDEWVALHYGEISAWFIATLDWSDVDPLFDLGRYISVWLRWVVVPVMALAFLARRLRRAGGPANPPAASRSAGTIRTLLIATAAFALLIVLPWHATGWRPGGLPATWIEPAVAVMRLSALGIVMAVGTAVMVIAAARR